MKIGVLTFKPSNTEPEKLESEMMLGDAVQTMGHEFKLMFAMDCQLFFGKKKNRVFYKNKPFPKLDAIIVRPTFTDLFSVKATFIKHLQFHEFAVLNGYMPVLAAKNRLRTLQLLRRSKVPIPRTLVVKSMEDLKPTLEKRLGSYPLLIKPVIGGRLVIAESWRSLASTAPFMMGDMGFPLIIQEYFPEAKGRDLQIIAVGDKVVAAVERIARKGEFRSDLSLGGRVKVASLKEAEKKIALHAMESLNLDFAGIDIIRTRKGPRVLQVSSNPGLSAIKEITTRDVAPEIVKHAIQKAKKHRHKKIVDVVKH